MPNTIRGYMNAVKSYHANEADGYSARAEQHMQNAVSDTALIHKATTEFFCNGYANLAKLRNERTPTFRDGYRGDFQWSVYFRDIARLNKRPYVTVEERYDWFTNNGCTWRILRVPRRKYLAPIINPFLLLEEKHYVYGQRAGGEDQVDAFRRAFPTYHEFYFATKEVDNRPASSTSMIDKFLASFPLDPEKRKALRLDNPVSWLEVSP